MNLMHKSAVHLGLPGTLDKTSTDRCCYFPPVITIIIIIIIVIVINF